MNSSLHVLSILAQALGVVVLADFASGIVHWLEDAYFDENTPLIGASLIRPNIVHHHLPRFFTRNSWWESAKELVLLGALTIAAARALGLLTWHVWLFVAISINANEVHKWSHRTRAENGRLISLLQDWKILQTPHQHGLHHTDPKNTYYCPVTNLVNPVLEAVRFWDHLEALIEKITGIRHRVDTAVRGQGPGPAWLEDYRPQRQTPCPARAAGKVCPHATSCRQGHPCPRARLHAA